MRDYTKINIVGRWVSPRGGTTANTINPATSPACESRDNRRPYFLHRFLPRLRGEGREPEADMSAISVSTPVPSWWLLPPIL
jgi:hypothetical protein